MVDSRRKLAEFGHPRAGESKHLTTQIVLRYKARQVFEQLPRVLRSLCWIHPPPGGETEAENVGGVSGNGLSTHPNKGGPDDERVRFSGRFRPSFQFVERSKA